MTPRTAHPPQNTMPEQNDSILRTFRLERTTIEDLQLFLQMHPEVGSLNHLVSVALKEFVTLHREDKSWLKLEGGRVHRQRELGKLAAKDSERP